MNGSEERQQPAPPLVELDEAGVSTLLQGWGFPFYDRQIKEHGITGEILIHLDHEALKDVGIHSVGQRLAILKAVYALKIEQNVPVEDGHYVPPSEDMDLEEGTTGVVPRRQIMGLLNERDDRIRNLESEVQRLHESILYIRDEALSKVINSKPSSRTGVRSPTGALFPHPLSNTSTLTRSNSNSRTRTGPETNGILPDSPRSPMDSPRMHIDGVDQDVSNRNQYGLQPHTADFAVPPFTSGALTPTTPTGPVSQDAPQLPPVNLSGLGQPQGSSSSNGAAPLTAGLSSAGSSRPVTGERDKERQHGSSSSANTSDNPYRSFRVTLEDPCYKVLPAALKKYKINDDWRQYALFICYDNNERCLAYDEKPLLLFQKLKESNSNPVFMLRHIKDIKSPITVASAKHALRRDKRAANAGAGLDKPPATDRAGAIIPPQKITRLHLPPVLLPVGKDKDKDKGEDGEDEPTKPPASPREAPGYCISIYPYLAEREDEFDVAVGDTFVIISKTKGWWVVHRDLGPSGASDLSTRKSAWVPAGCLLETNVPPLSLADATTAPPPGTSQSNAANVPIEPQYIVSVSTPGVALMDYMKTGSDELDVKKGTLLRILKRYNHWSYAIREDGQRGWLPSWFCGRTGRDGTPTTPTTTTSAAPTGRNGSVTALGSSTSSTANSSSNGTAKLASSIGSSASALDEVAIVSEAKIVTVPIATTPTTLLTSVDI